MVRLRQLVLAAREQAPVEQALRELLAAPAPHHDPDVGAFGLTNAVHAAGCDFVEVVSPSEPGTAAGRWLARNGGDGGYMLMVDGPATLTAPDRLAALAVREVHRVDLPDVVDVHLHPRDTGGVLLALDAVDPAGSWRWAGPAWTESSPTCAGGLREVTVTVPDPGEVTRRWAALLDVPAVGGGCRLPLDDGRQHLSFVAGAGAVAAVTAARLAWPGVEQRAADVGGVRFEVVPLEET
ncbi:hypothetical protein GCM10027451_30270 [Geodermatophilus aquaeductus]|uniref:Glyoxalase-like domain-containing protein n=1 Tax=Geodermatophilus aquaeductus TaxID=1564161 RepID=A0A521FL55_9ACTN|nr:hypothetical protein [Geodermatophilus aquaeductus]SMO96943.1 hypothetical protein SAMN06273567_110151 [Geodermatophilus aquaeductus]